MASAQRKATPDPRSVSGIAGRRATNEASPMVRSDPSSILSDTYAGGAITLPLAAVTATRPLGPITLPAPSTGTQFHVILVLPR